MGHCSYDFYLSYLIPPVLTSFVKFLIFYGPWKGKIQISMSSALKINFYANIRSKKRLTSYLATTAHYYSTLNQCIEHPKLAVREIPHPHTGLQWRMWGQNDGRAKINIHEWAWFINSY